MAKSKKILERSFVVGLKILAIAIIVGILLRGVISVVLDMSFTTFSSTLAGGGLIITLIVLVFVQGFLGVKLWKWK